MDEDEPPRKRVAVLDLAQDHLCHENREGCAPDPKDTRKLGAAAPEDDAEQEEPDAEDGRHAHVDVHGVDDRHAQALDSLRRPGCGPEAVETAPVTTRAAASGSPAQTTT